MRWEIAACWESFRFLYSLISITSVEGSSLIFFKSLCHGMSIKIKSLIIFNSSLSVCFLRSPFSHKSIFTCETLFYFGNLQRQIPEEHCDLWVAADSTWKILQTEYFFFTWLFIELIFGCLGGAMCCCLFLVLQFLNVKTTQYHAAFV